VEKPQEFISDLANVGLYYFPTHSVNFLPSKPVELVNEEYITDFMNLCVENNEVEVIGVDDLYFPISDLQDLQKAQELV
jgi:dTDP-glucose pyrophosphorylase